MQFAKKILGAIPNPLAVSREKDENFQHYNKLREKYQVNINKARFTTFMDYVQSLSLDPAMTCAIESHKENMGSYVYFFDIELANATGEKSSLKWTIRKRIIDFTTLDAKLSGELLEDAGLPDSALPQFSDFYKMGFIEVPEQFTTAASDYLTSLLQKPEVREKSRILYEFLEISLLPLPNGPQKHKEGYLKKRGGGRFKQNKIKLYVDNAISHWNERWFILTDEGVIYAVGSTSTKSREILLFDQSFQMLYGQANTGSELGILLVTPNRKLHLQAHNLFEALDWIGEIQKVVQSSPYTKTNRYMSFAPPREAVHNCKSYVDAEGYYSDLYDALMQAKSEVFITDWWLTPELPLKRPVQDGESEYRLDKVLGKIASTGVKVYVIVYHEVKMMMYNESDHVKKVLQSMSPNITVLQHPSEPFFNWSHHEKIVVIDQTVGFIGGFDLCFGRWDTNKHSLKDPAMEQGQGQTFFGQDYANPRHVDFRNCGAQPHMTFINKAMIPRMPFHDAMVRIVGPVVSDMARHFIQYYNHVTVDSYSKAEEAPLPRSSSVMDEDALRKQRVQMKFHSALRKIFLMRHMGGNTLMSTSATNVQLEPAKPYGRLQTKKSHVSYDIQSSIHQDLSHPSQHIPASREEGKEQYEGSNVLLTGKEGSIKEERAHSKLLGGLRDKGMSILGKAMDLSVNLPFVSQDSMSNLSKHLPAQQKSDKEYARQYSNLLEDIRDKDRRETNPSNPSQSTAHKLHHHQHLKSKLTDEEKFKITDTEQGYGKSMLHLLFTPKHHLNNGTVACQMVRSASKWSLGLNSTNGNVELSIQNAYIELIQNAKHFIYIENQFFMSSTAGDAIKNKVAEALLLRIEQAHARGERFRILVFLPLVPAFEGEVMDSKSAVLKIQMHWQYMTICRGGTSMYEQLAKKGIQGIDYIQFYSLRTHEMMPGGQPASEMIYIHSKILVVDDDILLIGSANINDRSLQGSGDSEVAMIFEDKKKVKTTMAGKEVYVSEFVQNFRARLLSEHLGVSLEEVKDPLTDQFIIEMDDITERNTLIYREVFACYPDDTVKTMKEMDEFETKKNLSKYAELAPKIKGHVVWFPLDFLCEETLTAPMTTLEHYAPNATFV